MELSDSLRRLSNQFAQSLYFVDDYLSIVQSARPRAMWLHWHVGVPTERVVLLGFFG